MPRDVSKAPASGNISVGSAPPFLPLEETMPRHGSDTEKSRDSDDKISKKNGTSISQGPSILQKVDGKKLVLFLVAIIIVVIIWESFFVDPKDRLLQPDFSDKLLIWVESHPGWGLGVISLIIAAGVVTMVPIGTPLTVGCGFVYRGVYGWKLGLFVATVVSMTGSLIGAVACFLLGRYLMRDTVQRWVRKYPLFDAIDVAASEQGLKIMAMLYLTPVLPLGLVSYMCGTTSMNIYSFSIAKIASLPLYLIYTFLGASAHSFIKKGNQGNNAVSATEGAKQIEENGTLIISGIVLSVVMMTLITRHIRRELMKILELQKKEKPGSEHLEDEGKVSDDVDGTGIELGTTTRRRGGKADHTDNV